MRGVLDGRRPDEGAMAHVAIDATAANVLTQIIARMKGGDWGRPMLTVVVGVVQGLVLTFGVDETDRILSEVVAMFRGPISGVIHTMPPVGPAR